MTSRRGKMDMCMYRCVKFRPGHGTLLVVVNIVFSSVEVNLIVNHRVMFPKEQVGKARYADAG